MSAFLTGAHPPTTCILLFLLFVYKKPFKNGASNGSKYREVAQSAEQWPYKLCVAGSSPAFTTNYDNTPKQKTHALAVQVGGFCVKEKEKKKGEEHGT